jgi:MFS family permease
MTASAATRPPLTQTFKAFRNPNYRLFWGGQFVSQIGTWMESTGLAWLVLGLTGSALALGTVTMVQFTPILLFSLFGGVIADRMPKHRLLVITQVVLMIQASFLAVLVATGTIRLEFIYILAAIKGTANAIDNPTRQAFVVEMVGPEDLPNAIALNSTQLQLSRLVGPALGGIAIATVGVGGCFFINAFSFLAVIAALLAMNASRFFLVERRPSVGNALTQVREGIGYALRTPDIALVVLTMGVLGVFGYNFTVLLPLIAKDVLQAGAVGFGALSSAMAIGSVVATLAVAYSGTATRRNLLLGAAGFSVMLLAIGLSHWWLLTVPLLIGMGFASSVYTATSNSRLQLVTPSHLRGRVMGIYMLLFAGSTPIGSLILGTLAEHGGVQPAVVEMAAVCCLGVAASVLYLRRNRVRLLTDSRLRADYRDRALPAAAADMAPVRPVPAAGPATPRARA